MEYIDKIIKNATVYMENTYPDFISVSIFSEDPLVLSFEFATDLSANEFQNSQALLGIQALISTDNPRQVLQIQKTTG